MTTDDTTRTENPHVASIRRLVDTYGSRTLIVEHAEALARQVAEAEARAARLRQYIMSIWEEEGRTDPREVEANISDLLPGDLDDPEDQP